MSTNPIRLAAIALGLAGLTGAAGAQVSAISPFAGSHSEDFEGQALQQNVVCIQERIFGDRADLCSAFGNGCSILDASSAPAGLKPLSGTQLFHADIVVDVIFDRPAKRFGGWFASPWAGAGTATFFDQAGAVIASEPFSMTPCSTGGCAWVWNGWDMGAGPPVAVIQLDTATATGGHFELEDLELDFACGFASTYCTAKVNSQGCTPSIHSSGMASASAGSGFQIGAAQVLNQKFGVLFYGKSGPAATPFQGGFLCAKAPLVRTPVQSSGGSPAGSDCSGSYGIDFNAWIASGKDPFLAVGSPVNAQYWSRDPGFAPPSNTGLTDALEFLVCP